MRSLRYALLLVLTFGLPALTHADLIFTLDTPLPRAKPVASLTVPGSSINHNGPPLFLAGAPFTLEGIGLTLDDTPFLLNAPPSLASGDSFTGTLFTVAIDPSAFPQRAEGAFHILG